MKKVLKATIGALAIAMPVLSGLLSYYFFNAKYAEVTSKLTEDSGKVAGVSTSKAMDLSKEVPIMPDAQIANVDTSEGKVSITLETKVPRDQVQTFYDDYLLINGWKQSEPKIFTKEGKELSVDISEDIIKLTLKAL